MADERYEWLDKVAAERLLRGEPVEAADEHARIQAARLSGALEGAGPAGYPDDGEMPGEAAAMAAFRKARADSAVPAGDTLGPVRLAVPARPAKNTRFGRPVRFGIVVAVACCALGGVAAAAGTGLLPTPFHDDEPMPATSVSAAATPDTLASESPTGGTASPEPSSEAPPTPSSPPPASSGSGTGPDAGDAPPSGGPTGGSDTQPGGSGEKDQDKSPDWYRKSVEACRDYRSGDLTSERKRRLEAAAKGPKGVERFCKRLLGDGKQSGQSDGDDSGANGGQGDGGDDDGKGSGGSGSDSDGHPGGAPVPPVSFSQLSAGTSPAPSLSIALRLS